MARPSGLRRRRHRWASLRSVTLTGADLYRLNCQACHGLEGRGAPPEIKSAVDPVRGVPLDVLRAQMKAQTSTGEAEAARGPSAFVRNC